MDLGIKLLSMFDFNNDGTLDENDVNKAVDKIFEIFKQFLLLIISTVSSTLISSLQPVCNLAMVNDFLKSKTHLTLSSLSLKKKNQIQTQP
jgi:hypothetical protein